MLPETLSHDRGPATLPETLSHDRGPATLPETLSHDRAPGSPGPPEQMNISHFISRLLRLSWVSGEVLGVYRVSLS
ncbi:unnamed protein product [Arctogadus glacialis]